MTPTLEKILISDERSFTIKRDALPYFKTPWHYHPEFELVYIEKSHGMKYIGDFIDKFSSGDMALLGANLPHMWKNDSTYYKKNSNETAVAWVLHFNIEQFSSGFFNLPEMMAIRKTLDLSQRGLAIENKSKANIIWLFEKLLYEKGSRRLSYFIDILGEVASMKNKALFASEGFVSCISKSGNEKLNRVFEYITMNFQYEVTIEEAARISNMSKTSFCRFFKKSTQKTFTESVNEIKVGYAKKMIMERSLNIAQISYECGFRSPTYFNRIFKEITNHCPSDFLKEQMKKHNI